MEKVKKEKPTEITNQIVWNWYQECEDLVNGGSVMALFLQQHMYMFKQKYGERIKYIKAKLDEIKHKYTMHDEAGNIRTQMVGNQMVSIFNSADDQRKYSEEVRAFMNSEVSVDLVKPN